jgi:glycosyltransferase involved in cell wall biosynthesis
VSGKTLRVALLNPVYWPEVRRGSERLARELADGLMARGHRVRLITSHPGRPTRTTEDGLEVVRTWRPPSGRLRRRLYEDHLTHVPLSYLELARGNDDVAQALYPTDALAAARWTHRTGRPSVLAFMGIPNREWLASRRWRAEVLERAIAGCGAVTVLSEAAARDFERWLGVAPRVIPAPVDVEAFAPRGERSAEPVVFCPAALEEPRKRVPLLVRAFARVRRSRPDARLVLSRPRDETLAGAMGALESVDFIDVDDRDRLAEAYSRAWVTALPSISEAFGLVLVESLACGTPVVGTDDGGIPEIVSSPAIGRLFSGDGEEELAGALLEALELAADPATAAACRARAEDFSVARCAERHEALYRELGA